MTAEDHYIQDSLEYFVPAQLQYLAEQRGVSDPAAASSESQFQVVDDYLADRNHTRESINENSRTATYLSNIERALPGFVDRLNAARPGAAFSFCYTGRTGRTEGRKGDLDVLIRDPGGGVEVYAVSLKNYESRPDYIQVSAGTFQSFVLGFVFEKVSVTQWRDPVDQSTKASSAASFAEWRNAAVTRNGYGWMVKELQALDELNQGLRAKFVNSGEFQFYDEQRVNEERKRVGAAGAQILHRILNTLPPAVVKNRLLKSIGFDGSEDMLVLGPGVMADTLTDPKFATLIRRVRAARLEIALLSSAPQSIALDFVDGDGIALGISIPCTINTNGAWYRDGEPYEGTRYHAKEGIELAYGQRRPKKSKELATSINTYLDLKTAGVFVSVPEPSTEVVEE